MSSDTALALTASLLRRGRQVERLSDVISLLALAYGLAPLVGAPAHLPGTLLCAGLLVAGLMQKFWALRVALDAELFDHLAAQPERLAARTQALDHALFALGLKPTQADDRDGQARSLAALGLLRRQMLCFAVQVLLALAGLLLLPWLPFAG